MKSATSNPSIVIIGGPNGAGKTTVSRAVISEVLGLGEFVNADVIAQGLSGFNPERAALQASRIMLHRLRELAAARESFAFESTLASRSFAPWLIDLQSQGYRVHIIFVWLKSSGLAIEESGAAYAWEATLFRRKLSSAGTTGVSPISSISIVRTRTR